MPESSDFYTFKGYQTNSQNELTATMEDYLEMIYRLLTKQESVRVNELSHNLNVKPSSVTKIVQTLGHLGYLTAEKYGSIKLTDKGDELGKYLLHRHEVLESFLCTLNHTSNELEQVEKLEHFFERRTVENLELLTKKMQSGNL